MNVTDEMVEAEELWENFQSRRFLHGHRETQKESFLVVSRAALSKAEPVGVGVKPIAWRGVGSDGVSDVTQRQDIADQWSADGLDVTPLAPLSSLSLPGKENGETVTPSVETAVGELLTTIKEFARWHHLNEMTIAAGKTPSDSEIDFEAIAWNRITRALASSEGRE